MHDSFSYALSGLSRFGLSTHGLRRGLHSFAASRLNRLKRLKEMLNSAAEKVVLAAKAYRRR
jgi:hypothetical protein